MAAAPILPSIPEPLVYTLMSALSCCTSWIAFLAVSAIMQYLCIWLPSCVVVHCINGFDELGFDFVCVHEVM